MVINFLIGIKVICVSLFIFAQVESMILPDHQQYVRIYLLWLLGAKYGIDLTCDHQSRKVIQKKHINIMCVYWVLLGYIQVCKQTIRYIHQRRELHVMGRSSIPGFSRHRPHERVRINMRSRIQNLHVKTRNQDPTGILGREVWGLQGKLIFRASQTRSHLL